MGTDISLFAERLDGLGWLPVPVEHFDLGRPYELFSVLYGSAIGLRNQKLEIPSVSKPRGAPEDVNPLLRELIKENCECDDGYNCWGLSWLMVSEFLDFQWDEERVRYSGFVRPEYASLFHPDHDFPGKFPEGGKLYSEFEGGVPAWAVEVEWSESVRAFIGCYDEVSQLFTSLGPPDEIRIVYWFDS